MTTLGLYSDNQQFPAAGSLTAGVSVATTGDKVCFTPNTPVRVKRWGIIVDTSFTVTPPVLKADLRPIAGSNTNRVTGAVGANGLDSGGAGTITSPAIGAAGTNQGQGLYHNVNTGPLAASGPEGLVVFPGQQIVFNVTTAATAGTGYLFVDYETLPFQGDPTTPGVGTQTTTVNALVNLVKVAS